jgi:hypothetical protein
MCCGGCDFYSKSKRDERSDSRLHNLVLGLPYRGKRQKRQGRSEILHGVTAKSQLTLAFFQSFIRDIIKHPILSVLYTYNYGCLILSGIVLTG